MDDVTALVDPGRIEAAALAVADEVGAPEPRLVRAGSAATFVAGDVVVRVQRDPAVGLVRWRTEARRCGVPVPGAVDGPFVVGGLSATVWDHLPDGGDRDLGGLGRALAGLHAAGRDVRCRNRFKAPSLSLALGALQPAQRRHLRAVCGPHAALAYCAATDRAAEVLYQSERTHGPTVVHGGAGAHAVVWSPHGPVLCGWGRCAAGTPEWDLVPVVNAVGRFGADPSDADRLFAGYGRDPRGTPGFDRLVVLREWMLVGAAATRAVLAGGDGPAAAEARLRADTLLGGDPAAWAAL